MANTFTEIAQTQLGDKHLTIFQVTGDGSTTTITPTSVDLKWIDCAWLQNVDDTNTVYVSDYASDLVADNAIDLSSAIANTKKQILFSIGVKNY